MSSIITLLAQALPNAAPAGPAGPWYRESWFNVIIALAVLVVPFVIGHWWAKKWRMADFGWRIGIILFSLTAGIVVCLLGWPPLRGIDLSGGVILVYEVDESKASGVDLNGVVDQLRKELGTVGGLTPTIAATDDGKVEITLPGANPAETAQVEEQLNKLRPADTELTVEGRPVHNGQQVLIVGVRHATPIDMDRMTSAIQKRVNPGGQKEVTVRRMGADRVEVIIPQAEPAEVDFVKDKISTAGALRFRILANPQAKSDERVIELASHGEGRDVTDKDLTGTDEVIAQWIPFDMKQFKDKDLESMPKSVTRANKKGEWERLVLITKPEIGGDDLSSARVGRDELGRPAVNFAFKSAGADKFGELTGTHLPDPNGTLKYELGIVLDDKLVQAAYIKSRITSSGEISGNFTETDVQKDVDILNAGSLPAALSKIPVSEYSASAQLGNDTIRAGALSMIVATVVILLFMQWYYRFAGFVANLAVLMNLVLIMAVMIMIKAHLTLAGLAGLVLSVGMAVDANVLIYERMREEQERGAALRMAIRNGFGRAMATIIDSHCTTLITGVVLFVIGTDQLRGFATTLVLGLLLNLFTAVYCSRIVFDIAERRHWLTKLRMRRIFGKTNFDFVKWMPFWMGLSVAVIIIGMGGAVAREMGWFHSAGLFGIDFTGGTAVQVVFKEQTDIAKVRAAVKGLPDVSVSAVASTEGVEHDTHFNIDTSYRGETTKVGVGEQAGDKGQTEAIRAVKSKLQEIFGGQLKTYSMKIASLAAPPVDPSVTETPAGEKPGAEKANTEKSGSKKSDSASKEKPAAEPAKPSAPAEATGTLATLEFPDGINYTSLEAMLKEAGKTAGLPDAAPDISSPDKEYTPGSSITLKDWVVRVSLPHDQTDTLMQTVQKQLAQTPVFPTANSIGGKVASDTETMAYYALTVSCILVALYIWIRFQNLIFGMAAIVALIHDVFIAVGALALSYWLAGTLGFLQVDPFKISLEVVAALLTIVGYSINDTIVVFDRIREIRGKSPDLNATMINQAVNQTLSRTILTSTTVFLVTAILYFFGGEGVHAFSFAMMIGVLTGTYSSVFIAAPILLWFRRTSPATGGLSKVSVNPPVRASGAA